MERGPERREPQAADASRRTRLANERTYLAWWRSAITAIAAGVAVGQLIPALTDGPRWPYVVLGAGFGAIGVALVGVAVWRYRAVEDALDSGRFARLDPQVAVGLAAATIVLGVTAVAIVLFVR